MRDLVTVESKAVLPRVALVSMLLAVFALVVFGIRWQLGNMLASLTPPTAPGASDIGDMAIGLAPSDPMAYWLRASADTAAEPNIELFENSVRLSPSDYRWHIELGRAYEQMERDTDAERELRRAVNLAPTYAYPHWQLGNFLLRRGKADDAFSELRKAASNSHTYREQVFSIAWDYFDKDISRVEALAPDTPDARAGLALFFAARGRAAEALRVWDSLTADDKAANAQYARLMAQGLYSQRCFPQALEFYKQLGIQTDAEVGTITNAGFERTVTTSEESPFGWQIARGEGKIDISPDGTTKHSGSRSLRIAFRNYTKPELNNIFQIVVVKPRTAYRLTFWVRTENLKAATLPLLQIMDANDDKLLGVSKSFNTGSSEWQQHTIEFQTPENCNGIRLQTSRPPCEQCPIVGTFWYDDFELTAS